MAINSCFENFNQKFSQITSYSPKPGCESFAKEEFIRFRSIAATILKDLPDTATSSEARYIKHILLRSLLENFFWLLYIFDDNLPSSWETKFNEYLKEFKIEYRTLYKEKFIPPEYKDEMEPPDPSWDSLKGKKNIEQLLADIHNCNGGTLKWIYFVYRFTSFDIHGKSLPSLFQSAFHKNCNFLVLKIDYTIELIADEYLSIFDKIKS